MTKKCADFERDNVEILQESAEMMKKIQDYETEQDNAVNVIRNELKKKSDELELST